VNGFAGFLSDTAEWDERTGWCDAGFFLELSASGGEQIFARFDDAFRDRPRASVAVSPKRTAWMRNEDLESALCASE
jgi:hypothetical protein